MPAPGITGTALESVGNLLLLVLWPLCSAGFLIFIALYSIRTFDTTTNIVGLGAIVIGVAPLVLNRIRLRRMRAA